MADAVLRGSVKIRIVRDPVLLRGTDEGLTDRKGIDRNGHSERAARSVILVGEALIVFRPFEIRKDICVAPARAITLRGPPVVVTGVAAGIDLCVDRGSPAN